MSAVAAGALLALPGAAVAQESPEQDTSTEALDARRLAVYAASLAAVASYDARFTSDEDAVKRFVGWFGGLDSDVQAAVTASLDIVDAAGSTPNDPYAARPPRDNARTLARLTMPQPETRFRSQEAVIRSAGASNVLSFVAVPFTAPDQRVLPAPSMDHV